MIGSTSKTRVFAYCQPIDMRKGFEGLSALVGEDLGRDPLDGAMYLFTNHRPARKKVLNFDGSGSCVFAKQLERGRSVALWACTDRDRIALTKSELEWFLRGSHRIGRFQLVPKPMTGKDLAVRLNPS